MSFRAFFILFIFLNIFIVRIQAGLLGLIGGAIGCTLACNAGYATCLAAGTATAGKKERRRRRRQIFFYNFIF